MRSHSQGRVAAAFLERFRDRKQRYQKCLAPFGLWEAFTQMTVPAQAAFFAIKYPDPVLVFDAALQSPKHRRFRIALEKAFRSTTVEINGRRTSILDVLGVLLGIAVNVRFAKVDMQDPKMAAFMELARDRLAVVLDESIKASTDAIYHSIRPVMMVHSKLDTRVFIASPQKKEIENKRMAIEVHISFLPAEERVFSLENGPRRAYRVMSEMSGQGVSLTGEQLGMVGAKAEQSYPVYVQSHALHQLRERVNLEKVAPYAEGWLIDALTDPKIIRRQGRKLFLEYRVCDGRVGYLVLLPVDGCFVILTFLFLTMDQTPEARLLHRRLRLTRQDVTWLGLHDLAAFTTTDLSSDKTLRPLLESCGCSHLFTLVEPDKISHPRPVAEEMKRYLRLAA